MALFRIIVRRRSSCGLRLMAFTNTAAFTFVVTMTLMTTLISFFIIVPTAFDSFQAMLHRCVIVYLFINTCGNFLLCVYTDTSTARDTRPGERPAGRGRKGPEEAPPRSHLCRLCEKRILRRDHHCFFMTVCIGYFNHKHFIFFCFFMMLGALYAVVLTAKYLAVVYRVRFWGPHSLLLVLVEVASRAVVRGVAPPPFLCYLLLQLYVCLAVGLTAAGFFYWHLAITCKGQTTHEATRGDGGYGRGVASNLRDVMGRLWPLLFLLPLPLPQGGDGRRYPRGRDQRAGRPRGGGGGGDVFGSVGNGGQRGGLDTAAATAGEGRRRQGRQC